MTSRSSTDAEKAEQRAAAKRAAVQRAAAVKRRERLGVAAMIGAGLVAVALIVGIAVFYTHKADDKKTTAAAPAPSAAAPQPSQPAADPNFPPVPEGSDPALKTPPKIGPGTGAPPTKLVVTKLITGKGAAVKSGQSITVNYVGETFKDGKVFDASWTKQQAFTTVIGKGQLIKGWDQGIPGIPVGSRVQLDIPGSLAYGEGASQAGGPPMGALRFVVDILAAK